jgi:hypothetical protein
MDALSYYSPATGGRYFECEASGKIDKPKPGKGEDSKIASSKLKLNAEIGLAGIIKAQIDFAKKWAKGNIAQGYCGHAAAQGNCGHAAAQGYCGHAAAQGDRGHAEVHGKDAIAAAFGIEGAALGELGDWIVCAEWEEDVDAWHISSVKAAKVDGEKIKPNVWYKLVGGEFVEAEQ